MSRPPERRVAPETKAPVNDSLFAVDLDNIHTLLELVGDKEFRITRSGDVVLEPAPTRSNALADEILRSMQPFLRHAWWGAGQWAEKPASWPWEHVCGSWRMMTAQRAKTRCECGDKTPWKKIHVPWWGANRYNRPDAGQRLVEVETPTTLL
jgi:hypothetical protein